jgi:hypothetical protein
MKYTLASIINYVDFGNYLRGDLNEFRKEIEETRKALQQVSGRFFYNNTGRFSNIFGTEMKFSIYPTMTPTHGERYDLTIYDYRGDMLIWQEIITPDTDRNNLINRLMKVTEEWTRGNITCSNCGNLVPYYENMNHRYYAGIYCNECWESKFKAIEAAETYN